ncbi:hypothetical protein EVAR_37886_1 [Eumeta japonica]|uniref:Uncharacterized protein n=1 Tax=Eumeta variegata TaxID=151549 RepID=A0A4C1Y570_EUMVA|nr:hypothetical protein EVAR_37886_1 [Eumeta japonica]
MLAKQIKEYPKLEREEIMYEIHGVMMNRRRRYNSMMQSTSYTVSSPSQVILSRPSTSNSVYLSTPSPNFVVDSPYSVETVPQNEVNQQSEMTFFISYSRGKRAASHQSVDDHRRPWIPATPKGVISALLASWERIGYLTVRDRDRKGERGSEQA